MCKQGRALATVLMLSLLATNCGSSPTSQPTVELSNPGSSPIASSIATQTSVPQSTSNLTQTTSTREPTVPSQPVTDFIIELGNEEDGLPSGSFGLTHLPDGHISFIQMRDQLNVWISAGVSAYLFRGSTFERLTPHEVTPTGQPVPVLGPSGSGFDSDYAAFGAILPGDGPQDLLGLYHAEQCGRSNYTASVGLGRSTDGGVAWQRLGPIVTGQNLAPPCSRITGAGQPSAVLSEGYIYLYYVDWSTGPGEPRADQIYLARVSRARANDTGAWEKYTGKGFGSPGLGGSAEAVIPPPEPSSMTHYAALPSISFNSFLKQYLAVFETDIGFYYTVSPDGIKWQPARRLFDFPQPQSKRESGSVWYSYPSLLSPTEPSHLTTSQTGYLYFSKGLWNRGPHSMFRRRFTIRPVSPTSLTPSPAP